MMDVTDSLRIVAIVFWCIYPTNCCAKRDWNACCEECDLKVAFKNDCSLTYQMYKTRPIVFCPKYRYRILKEAIGEYVRQQVYQLCKQKEEIEVLEMNIQPDHVHLVVSIPPKYKEK